MEVLYLMLVLSTLKTQIFHVISFTNPCESSLATVDFVERCPNDTDSYMKAAARKNCSARQHSCTSFEYHCVLNDWKNATMEVCAPSIKIIGRVCTEFDIGLKSIFRMEGTNCGDAPPCPDFYNSTEAYKYPSCFDLARYNTVPVNTTHKGSGYSTTEENQSTRTGSGYSTTDENKLPSKSSFKSGLSDGAVAGIIIGAVLGILIAVILPVCIIYILKRKDKACFAKTPADVVTDHDDHEVLPLNQVAGADDPRQEVEERISQLHKTHKPYYMAYTGKETRQKSFDDCVNFLKNKSNEFAVAGFYYKGYNYVVACYYCGKEGTEWTENATRKDIITKHYQLNPECKYIGIIRNHYMNLVMDIV